MYTHRQTGRRETEAVIFVILSRRCFVFLLFSLLNEFLNLIFKNGRNLMLARGFGGQLLEEGNIEGNLERRIGLEGCGVNTFGMGPSWVR